MGRAATRLGSPAGCGGLVACHRGRGAARAVLGIGRRTAGAADGFRLQRRRRGSWSPGAPCSASVYEDYTVTFSAAWRGSDQRPRAQACRLERAERLAARRKRICSRPRAGSTFASTAASSSSPGVRRAAGFSRSSARSSSPSSRAKVAPVRYGSATSGSRITSPLTGARASASSALPGFDADQALGGSGWMPQPRRCEALDCARLHRGAQARWAHHRLARRRTGERLPGASIVARSALADAARDAACGRRAQLRLPAEPEDALSSAGAERTVAGAAVCTPSRSSSAVRSRPSGTTSLGTSRVAGIRAGCIASKRLWTPIGTANGTHCALMNEEGAVETDAGVILDRADGGDRRPALYLGGRRLRQELLAGCCPCRLRSGKPQSGACAFRAKRRRAGSFVCAIASRIARTGPCRRACWCSFARFR